MFLITTSDGRTWKKDERILFLGGWCKLHSRRDDWAQLDYEVLPYHWDDRNLLYHDYKYLSDVYERYLKEIAERLNFLHSITYSLRSWRIVIGPWLRYFVDTLYDRYLSITAAADSGKVTSTWILETDPVEWIPRDFEQCMYFQKVSDQWNHFIYGEIIKKLNGFPYLVIKTKNISSYGNTVKNKELTLKKVLKKAISIYHNNIPDRFNSCVFAQTYFDIKSLIKLQISLGQIPYLYSPPFSLTDNIEPDMDIRKQLNISKSSNEFEKILACLIPFYIPLVYLEGFSQLRAKALSVLPEKPKVIYTEIGFNFNELLKVNAAECTDKGSKFLIGQHGGTVGATLFQQTLDHQIGVSDLYYSWGWSDSEKVKPKTAAKLINVRRNITPDQEGGILLGFTGFPRYFYMMHSQPVANQFQNCIDQAIVFSKSLSEESFKLLRLRLSCARDYGWDVESRFKDSCTEITMDSSALSFRQSLRRCRLCVSTYNGTIFLEAFTANYPTLLYWNPEYFELRPDAKPYYDELHSAGILHYTPESAARKVNEIYKDPLEWWHLPEIQNAKDYFCKRFAYIGKDWLDEWRSELMTFLH